jgi:hypothetical protein
MKDEGLLHLSLEPLRSRLLLGSLPALQSHLVSHLLAQSVTFYSLGFAGLLHPITEAPDLRADCVTIQPNCDLVRFSDRGVIAHRESFGAS